MTTLYKATDAAEIRHWQNNCARQRMRDHKTIARAAYTGWSTHTRAHYVHFGNLNRYAMLFQPSMAIG